MVEPTDNVLIDMALDILDAQTVADLCFISRDEAVVALARVQATRRVRRLRIEADAFNAGRASMRAGLQDAKRDGDMEYARALASDGLPSDEGCGVIPGEDLLGRSRAVELYRAGERDFLAQAREGR